MIIWKKDVVVAISLQIYLITVKLKSVSGGFIWFLTELYGACMDWKRGNFWEELSEVAYRVGGPWCIDSASKMLLNTYDRKGGAPVIEM